VSNLATWARMSRRSRKADNSVSSLARNEVHLAHASVLVGNRMAMCRSKNSSCRYFRWPPNRPNVFSSSSPVRLIACRSIDTSIKMIVIVVVIGMWIDPRSVVIAFIVGEIGRGFDGNQAASHLPSNIVGNFS
jgi:hypothetical protein